MPARKVDTWRTRRLSVKIWKDRLALSKLTLCPRRIPDEGSGYKTRLLPRFFAHIRDKLLQAHLCTGLNRVPRTE